MIVGIAMNGPASIVALASAIESLSPLTVAKYAAIIVALASTVWATIKKTEDKQGRKPVTVSSYTPMALAIAAAIIAILSYGFETAEKQAAALAAWQEQQQRDNAAAAQRAEDQATIALRWQREDAERLSDRLAGEAQAGRQEFLIETRAQQAASLQRLLAQRQRFERLEESQYQTERLTGEISRSILTLDGAHISVLVTSDLGGTPLAGFERRMLDAHLSGRLGLSVLDLNTGRYEPFYFMRMSFPPNEQTEFAYHYATRPVINFAFRLRNGEVKQLRISDVWMGPTSHSKTWIGYDRQERHLISLLSRIQIRSALWHDTGPVRSVPDLLGAEVTIELIQPAFWISDNEHRRLANDLSTRNLIRVVLMDLPSFGQLCFLNRHMRGGRGPRNSPIFQISLPASLGELRRLLSPQGERECQQLRPSILRHEID